MYWNEIVGKAIEGKGSHQPLIALQPIVPLWDLSDRTFFEVLIRLRAPSGEILTAGAFIDAIDKDERLMMALDRWILERVATKIRKTKHRFAVNITAYSIRSAYFPQFLANTLHEASAPSRNLFIELSEKDAIGYGEKKSLEMVGQNHPLLLDDFGALENHCSSFGYTLYKWVKGIKIDSAFTKLLLSPTEEGENARVGIESLVRWCARRDRLCILEGVESKEQIEYLQRNSLLGMGLLLQGWAIGMPEIEE